MTRDNEKLGVVLLNLGGPDTLEAVEPFLKNLFRDPDIINFPGSFLFRRALAHLISTRRAPRVMVQYQEIGGGSPLKAHTLRQASLLEDRLNRDIRARVVVAMRYWHPFTSEALDQLESEGIRRAILLPLYPQFSKATTASSVKEWTAQFAKRPAMKELEWELIERYYDHPGYIDSLVERIDQAAERFPAERKEKLHIVFSAHGTPMKLVREGDPYSNEIKKTVHAVVERAGITSDWSLCYQSKVGPQKWLTPSTPETIEKLASQGVEDMLVVPVAFTSDHLETLFELGVEYRKLAHASGVRQYEITEGLNDSATFIDALADLVLTRLGKETGGSGEMANAAG
jgi:protoporphyrin/coproporphyrin ferrochelatase